MARPLLLKLKNALKEDLRLQFILPVIVAVSSASVIFSQSSKEENQTSLSLFLSANEMTIEKSKEFSIDGDVISIDQAKMYVCNVVYIDANFNVIHTDKSTYLIDFFQNNQLPLKQEFLDRSVMLNFTVGTDTILTSMPPLKGVLAASHGMFWSWTNGFMALKMEGHHSNSSLAQKNFSFHLSEFSPIPSNVVIVQDLNNRTLSFDITSAFKEYSFAAFPSIMEPSEMSVNFLQQIITATARVK